MAQSDAPPAAAAAFARLGHVRTGSGGSSSAGGGGSSSTSRPRADGLSQEQLAGVRAANTQDPALSREALQRLGECAALCHVVALQAACVAGWEVELLSCSRRQVGSQWPQ